MIEAFIAAGIVIALSVVWGLLVYGVAWRALKMATEGKDDGEKCSCNHVCRTEWRMTAKGRMPKDDLCGKHSHNALDDAIEQAQMVEKWQAKYGQ